MIPGTCAQWRTREGRMPSLQGPSSSSRESRLGVDPCDRPQPSQALCPRPSSLPPFSQRLLTFVIARFLASEASGSLGVYSVRRKENSGRAVPVTACGCKARGSKLSRRAADEAVIVTDDGLPTESCKTRAQEDGADDALEALRALQARQFAAGVTGTHDELRWMQEEGRD